MNEHGFSLVESLLVIVIIGSIVFLLASLPNAFLLFEKSKHLSLAREIAVKQLEDKRTTNYANLINDNSPISDSRLNLLPQAFGNIIVEDCNASICSNNENIKQVTASVSWTDKTQVQNITLKTLVSEGGIN